MFTKHLYVLSIFLILASISWSQSGQDFVHWQKSIGSQGEDKLNDIVTDADGSFYVIGSTQTLDNQTMDIMVSKFSAGGYEIWSKIIGEHGDDRGIAIELLNDELYIVASSTSSTGVFTGNLGREDAYLIRLSLEGTILQSIQFGGNYSDIPSDLNKTLNGELLISAHSKSTEGFFDSNKGQTDMWVIRTNSQGELIWKHNYGGSEEDFSSKIDELPNGEIVLSGHSSSFDDDILVNYGDLDLSLFKLNSTGTILWVHNYGGLQAEVAVDLLVNDNGEIILAGNTLSLSYDISKNAGFSDAWILEINPSNGLILWEETHGSEFGDYASALALDADNQLYVMGTTNATTFQGESSQGSKDIWLAKVNSPNSIEHIALFGGNGFESVSNFSLNQDGSILLIGTSNSTNDLFSNNNGKSDGWIMKAELNILLGMNENETVSAHPNPTSGTVYLNNLTDSDEIVVYNSIGQVIEIVEVNAFSQVLDLTGFTPGIYLIQVQRTTGSELIRLTKN